MKEQLEEMLGNGYTGLQSVVENGRTWYSAKSVCEILGVKNRTVAVKGNARIGYFGIDDQDVCKFVFQKKRQLFVSERGVYMLILKSRKPLAYQIKSRLSCEVLPSIMRSGLYRSEPEVDLGETSMREVGKRLRKRKM
jgi:prophage antirepressor-like protein